MFCKAAAGHISLYDGDIYREVRRCKYRVTEYHRRPTSYSLVVPCLFFCWGEAADVAS